MNRTSKLLAGSATALTLLFGQNPVTAQSKTDAQKSAEKMKSETQMKLTPSLLKTRTREFYEQVVNKQDLTRIEEFVASQYKEHSPMQGMEENRGPEAVRQGLAMMFRAFPDMKFEVHDVVADGNQSVVRMTMTGTHKGEFMGIQPTGKKVSVDMMDWIIATPDAKARDHWGLMDTAALMQQLGKKPQA